MKLPFKYLILEKYEGIVTIYINRPEQHNALNRIVEEELKNVINDAYSDDSIRGIIITGSGEKSFVAGGDIKEFSSYSPEQISKMGENGQKLMNIIENCPKPIIAAVNGYAYGGGCELAMSCHIRVASENATFSQPEVNLGFIPGYGGTQRLIQIIGKTKAFELLLTGDIITAEEAMNLNLVNYVTSKEELISQCKKILRKIMTKSPAAIASIINSVNSYYTECIDGFQTERNEFTKCAKSEDLKEGIKSFIEKRKPNFKI
ncbi:MAG: enoyl-CoA hydratase-related protein [Bacteroidota bacterium]